MTVTCVEGAVHCVEALALAAVVEESGPKRFGEKRRYRLVFADGTTFVVVYGEYARLLTAGVRELMARGKGSSHLVQHSIGAV